MKYYWINDLKLIYLKIIVEKNRVISEVIITYLKIICNT